MSGESKGADPFTNQFFLIFRGRQALFREILDTYKRIIRIHWNTQKKWVKSLPMDPYFQKILGYCPMLKSWIHF